MKNNEIKNYSKRVVVFMDILGFKNKVEDANEKDKLFKLMNYLRWINDDHYNGPLSKYEIGKEITVFSDSIVISYDVEKIQGCVFHILLDIIHVQIDLAGQGVLVRGGVAIGELYHHKEIIFGKAMNDAYYLESEIAKNPRIIIDEDVIKYGILNPPPQNTQEQELEYISSLLSEDDDGYWYTNFLNQQQELDDPEDLIDIHSKLRKLVNSGLKSDDEGIRKKYEWLKLYMNS